MSGALGSSIADSDVAAILRQPSYLALEHQIARGVGQPILVELFDLVVPLVTSELREARLDLRHVQDLLTQHSSEAEAFGVALLRGEGALADVQEWDPDEGNQQLSTDEPERLGLSPGFALTYLLYLNFLCSGRDAELLRHFKNRRIPKASQFLRRLKSYYENACAV